MHAVGVVLTIVVLTGVALFILLFEGCRARRIERDLGGMSGESTTVPLEIHLRASNAVWRRPGGA